MAQTDAAKARGRILKALVAHGHFMLAPKRINTVLEHAIAGDGCVFSRLERTRPDGTSWQTLNIGFRDGSVLRFSGKPVTEDEERWLMAGRTTRARIAGERLKSYACDRP